MQLSRYCILSNCPYEKDIILGDLCMCENKIEMWLGTIGGNKGGIKGCKEGGNEGGKNSPR